MENELATRGGGVDLLCQALKADLAVVEFFDAGNEVFEGAAEPVQLPNNQGVSCADV
jgi:hypothetical protein